MAIFLFFKMAAAAVLDFENVEILGVGRAQDGQSSSPCQISRRSGKPLLRNGHFSICQDGDRRHLGF